MQISNDPMQETPFFLKERRPFALTLTCEKQDKSRLDLTDCSVELTIAEEPRKGGAVQRQVLGTIVAALDGIARFELQAPEVNFGHGTFDMAIALTTAEGFKSTIIEGKVEVAYNPDPQVPAAYSSVVPPLSLTARFRDHNQVSVRVNHHPDSVLLDMANRATFAMGGALIAAEEAETYAASAAVNGVAVITHGINPNVPRPAVAVFVHWVGTATPNNARPYDFWTKVDI